MQISLCFRTWGNAHLQQDLILITKEENRELAKHDEEKVDDWPHSLWKDLRPLAFRSFLSLTRFRLYLLENGAFMKLFKNLITAAPRMLLHKTNTVSVYNPGDGISAL